MCNLWHDRQLVEGAQYLIEVIGGGWWFVVFNATFNNISVISWWSVLLVEETGVLGEDHRPVASHWQTLLHNVVSSTPRHAPVSTYLHIESISLHTIYNHPYPSLYRYNLHSLTLIFIEVLNAKCIFYVKLRCNIPPRGYDLVTIVLPYT